MYLDSAPNIDPPAPGTDRDALVRQRLWRMVLAAFPGQTGSRFRLEGGGDHLLLVVDDVRAFRFPRPHRHGFDLEIAVLRRLAPFARVAIPNYDLVDPDGGFASYLLIPGVPLTPACFSRLSTDEARVVIGEAVTLLKRLHGIDPVAVSPLASWPRLWGPNEFADRLEQTRLPLLATRRPFMVAPIEAFLERYRRDRSPRDVVLHGDLVDEHLLIGEHDGHLSGIIDFSDVALGDPAHDLLGFWAYDGAAAVRAVDDYGSGNGDAGADPTLLARSRNHYIRYRIDRLYEAVADEAPAAAIDRGYEELGALLAS